MKYVYLIVAFLTSISLAAQSKNIYKQCFFLADSIECNSVTEAVVHFKNGDFTKPFGNNVYHIIPSNKTVWFHFKIPPHKNHSYFTIANSYLHHGKVYTYNDTQQIDSLATINYYEKFGFKNVFYRHPTWELKATNKTTDCFIQIRDDEPKARLELIFSNTNEFLKRNQIEYFLLGTTLTFLSSLILIILCLFVTQKQFSLLWYGGFILFLITAILANKGVGAQYIWNNYDFLIQSAKSFSHTLATMCAAFFYANFYPLKNKYRYFKKIFLGIGYICLALALVYVYKMCFGGLPYWYLFVWTILKICLVSTGLIHAFLLIKKIIPAYLAIGFIVSIIGTFTYQFYNPIQNSSLLKSYFFTDIFYLTVILELVLIMFYIISEIVKGKLLSITLEKENLKLRTSLLGIEDQQKHKFSSNVHDTFGSYIEALNLQVLTNPNTEKLTEIISAFRNEYQLLLTNMFIPNVYDKNFRESIENYCDKMKSLTSLDIHFSYTNTTQLPIPKIHAQEIYKIITELSANVIKHSKAEKLVINFVYFSSYLSLEVKDNGTGFSIVKNTKGVGLQSVKNRVQLLKGTFYLDSIPNTGTTIKINLPI
ncbi:7TM diverse intracellular signaling domain-containing protein [Wenyingzhuangia sp. 2_MG-2023]|uniref:sensor histidine kinase n=1 Tax=Wenyingzhuangia sp. 2_MG-2023 TaxID=3062639 RepID=UPI0026E1EE16|nr:7TM diverse intracellular signaling domain-containing protein [Wenyingzhuangia sp. 2_MG-2023]MDO6737624.1 7TM diverse intracellular signaling domain-containing protein [Wenyingzhuangia sp. 2_MG-2023]